MRRQNTLNQYTPLKQKDNLTHITELSKYLKIIAMTKKKESSAKFEEFKKEILIRAKNVSACQSQYERAYKSVTFAELFTVIKYNFNYCCNNKIIDGEILTTVKEQAKESDIFVNESTKTGFLFAGGNATVEARG